MGCSQNGRSEVTPQQVRSLHPAAETHRRPSEHLNRLTMSCCSPPLPLLLLLLLLSFLTLLVGGAKDSGFKICAFNLQKFNLAKATNYRVQHTVLRIVSRYDVCLLQEVMDPDGKAIKALLSALNRYDDYRYQSVSSQSLGNTANNMQQYVFIYRTQTVNVTGQHQYQKKQSFIREPFVVQLQSDKTAVKKFILVALHTHPNEAVGEMDRLYDVFEEVSMKWKNTQVMFLGDFHAACASLTKANKKSIRLFTNSSFSWLIGDKVDTTVSDDTTCAYDRIVVHGEPFLKAITPFSAKVFNYLKEFKLSKTKALAVSNNFPVEVRLKSAALLLQASPLLILLIVSVMIQSFPSTV